MPPIRPWLRMRVEHPRLRLRQPRVGRQAGRQEDAMIVGELEPELLLDTCKLSVAESCLNDAHRPRTQTPHGFLTQLAPNIRSHCRTVRLTSPVSRGNGA